jgi:uncharacterized Zn-finger protein
MPAPVVAPPPPETIEVDGDTAVCDGGGGALGHPRIYIPLKDGVGECGYCDRRFQRRRGAGAGGH